MNESLTSVRTLALGSDCKIEFLYSKTEQKIIPVLMLTGIKSMNNDPGRVYSDIANGHIGIVEAGYDTEQHTTYVNITGLDGGDPIKIEPYKNKNNAGDWLIISQDDLNDNKYKIVYPRLFINSLGLRTDSDSLILKYKNNNINDPTQVFTVMQPYEDYSILSRSLNSQYALTLNNDTIFKNNLFVYPFNNTTNIQFFEQLVYINYILSNADVAIYLDALQVAKENASPKVSYNITANYFDEDFINFSPSLLGYLVRINDQDLKLNNTKGYISEITLDLDNPDQDSYNIKNYKTKFEDLFSTITAQTEEMKKNSQILQFANSAFTSSGDFTEQVLQSSIKKVDLDYAFDNGKLTIDEKNGIWGISDTGVVAFRGGGIFTATEKNSDGSWRWNTGITPEGINADLITTGQLDTNLIKIYAGDHLRFQMNGDGIFAYKTKISDAENKTMHPLYEQEIKALLEKQANHTITAEQLVRLNELQSATMLADESLDEKQFVVFNDNGLSLIAKKGAQVLNNDKTKYTTVLDDSYIFEPGKNREGLAALDQITRVEVSWQGLILRNWDNERVFFADPDTGNLTLKGKIEASSGHIGTWQFDENKIWSTSRVVEQNSTYYTYVALNSGGGPQEINGELVNTAPFAFWAGSEFPDAAPFYIRKDGAIKATTGKIGGWDITSNKIYSNNITLFSGNVESFSVDDSSDGASAIVGGQTITPVLWVHGTKTTSTNISPTTDAQYSLCNINTDGNIMAQDFYLISNTASGKITEVKSIRKLLERLAVLL